MDAAFMRKAFALIAKGLVEKEQLFQSRGLAAIILCFQCVKYHNRTAIRFFILIL